MNGKDDKFSIGLSKGNESVSKWIIPESQIIVVDEEKVSLNEEQNKESTVIDAISRPSSDDKVDTPSTATDNKLSNGVVGQKRKHEEEPLQSIIPNTFKKSKTDSGCQNSKSRD